MVKHPMKTIPKGTRVILLDIMGTTTPESYFLETLPQYAKAHLSGFLERFRSLPEVKSNLADLKRMHSDDVQAGESPPPWDAEDARSDLKCIMDYCCWLIDLKSNAPPLRYLEDYVWEEGYRSGKLQGEVYPELPEVMDKWRSMGLSICTYSSGSVFSQQLIFTSTKHGDLMPLIKGYFDTSVGAKNMPQSYTRIAGILGVRPEEIIYFSRSLEEVKAAKKAGLKVILMVRERAVEGSEDPGFESLSDFSVFMRTGIEK